MDNVEIIIASIITGLVTLGGSYLLYRSNKRANDRNAENTANAHSLALMEASMNRMDAEITSLRKDREEDKKRIDDMEIDLRAKDRVYRIVVDEYYKLLRWVKKNYPDDDFPSSAVVDDLK